MKRRDFLKYGAGTAAGLAVGNNIPWLSTMEALGQVPVQELNFTITDALKGMATDVPGNAAKCYFWIYQDTNPTVAARLPADCPGPSIFVQSGQQVTITLTNALDEPHSFFIPGMFNSGAIAPGQTVTRTFTATTTGSHLYFDSLNAPVNRVMGLHGAFIVMPDSLVGAPGARVNPYGSRATPSVASLFNDFGATPWWPGLAWEQGDAASGTPPFRQYIWLLHQASPNLFQEVGSLPAGQIMPGAAFRRRFLFERFSPAAPNRNNAVPQYFTISGQSGHFSHNNPYICPNNRVGEPVVIHLLNAGLWTHSMHIHANHVYITYINGVVQPNPIWVDVYNVHPGDRVDYVTPYMRPPDVPNVRGIGRADEPLLSHNDQPVWPPNEELAVILPNNLFAQGGISLAVQLSPLCYPMHDHSEPSQTSQGGNYNMGMISGINFTGDRNINAPAVVSFPNLPAVHGPGSTPGCFPPTVQEA